MINRRNYKNICVLLALTSISCSDSEGWMSSIPLSNEKISFTASLQEGWSGGQGSGDKSRAVKPDFPGLAREQKVLTTDEAFSKPLYLHPIETVNKTQKNLGPTTRGTMSSEVGNFGVSANHILNGGGVEPFFHNQEAIKVGNNWFVADNKTWPLDGSVSFYAYAPYNDPSFKLEDNKTIHYIVPADDIKKQPDFIVAKSDPKSFSPSSANTPVELQFHHALTAITFSVSDDMEKGNINSITIEGVKGEGDYNYDLSDNNNKWDSSKSKAAGSYTVSFTGVEGKVEGQRALTGGVKNDNKVLMMIPQMLDNDAKVTINFTPAGGTDIKKASFPLGGTKWDSGRRITYVLSTTKMLNLNIGTITYPDGWKKVNDNAERHFKSSYTNDDFIGMYVVDKNNKVIEENLKFKYDGSKWTNVSGKEFKGSPQYNYFVYYPYQEGRLPGAPVKNASNIDVTSAKSFFADAITEWCNKFDTSRGQTIDQSDIANMNSFDLQIGMADGLGETATTIDFNSMEHAMGLAEIVLGEKIVGHIYKTQQFGKAGVYTWGGDKIGVYASNKISGYNPFNIANHKYVTIVRPQGFADATKLETAVSDADGWKEPLSFSPLGNKVQTLTAENKRTAVETDYPIGLGYIFYNDGSISKDLTGQTITSDHRPVGIIVYLADNKEGNDMWAETNTKIGEYTVGGHGLVMCLKTIGSTGPTNFGNKYAYSGDFADTEMDNVGTKEFIVNSKNQSYGSGYKNTNYLIGLWSSTESAAYQAKNYKELPVNSSKCTGWFLPSAGQYYAALSQCGGMSPDWKFGSGFNVTTKINDMLKNASDSNYTVFFPQGSNVWVWTSSESSSTAAVAIFSGVDDSKGSGSVLFGTRIKRDTRPVRPFLAF